MRRIIGMEPDAVLERLQDLFRAQDLQVSEEEPGLSSLCLPRGTRADRGVVSLGWSCRGS